MTGEPNSGGGDVGGGGEGGCFSRTEAIKGAGEGDHKDWVNAFWAVASRHFIN